MEILFNMFASLSFIIGIAFSVTSLADKDKTQLTHATAFITLGFVLQIYAKLFWGSP